MMKKIIIAVVSILIALAAWYGLRSKPAVLPVLKPVPVQLSTVYEHNIPVTVTAMGHILAPQTVMLEAKQPGAIKALYFKSGGVVKKGQALIQIDSASQRAAYLSKTALYEKNKQVYDRYVEANKRLPDAVSKLLVAQAKNDTQSSYADMLVAKQALGDTLVRAPFAGTMGALQTISSSNQVGITQVSVGAFVVQGTPLVLISNIDNKLLEYQVSLSSYPLALKQKVIARSSAYPKQKFSGYVSYVSPTVDQTTQAQTVHASITANSALLTPGMFVFVKQTLKAENKVIAIPGLALVPSLSGYSVYTVSNNKIQSTPVTIGQRFNTLVVISKGLKVGDKIVVSGVSHLSPGQAVEVTK